MFILAVHLMVTLAKLTRSGGARSVIAESLLIKHQLIASGRPHRRALQLTTLDRFVFGSTTMLVSPRRAAKVADPQACNAVTIPRKR